MIGPLNARPAVILLILSFTLPGIGQDYALTWDYEISVNHGSEMFDKEELYAYSTMAYEVRRNDLRKLVLDQVKEFTSQKATKKALTEGIKVTLPAFEGEDIAVKVKSEDLKETNDVRVIIAFLKGNEVVNPTDFPEGHQAALKVTRNMGIFLNQSVVAAQMANAEEELEDLQNKRESLAKNKNKLEETIVDGEADMRKLELDNGKLQQKLVKAQAEAASLEVAAKSASATAGEMKKYVKAKNKAESLEAKSRKNDQSGLILQSEIDEARAELPLVEQEISAIETSIEEQKTIVDKLNAKHDAIQ